MGAKVTFDLSVFEIIVTLAPVDGVVSLNFKVDVYSDGKEDWLTDPELAKVLFPISAVGGNPIPGGMYLDSTFFIAAPWKIRPYDADHELIVSGNVYRDDGASVFLTRPGRTIITTLSTTFSASASASGVYTPAEIAVAIWDAQQDAHTGEGSFGLYANRTRRI